MAYVSLYRKYRPQSFAEVVGQRHVTQTLANAIAEDRLHHAYLFTGPRGTGKTSTARILAKAVNCDQGPTPDPCQVCDLCVQITGGSSVDVIELDMASHGGVDDARELRERAMFAPARARKKAYILDEVHMASTAAFNALLKLIEEPPHHVMFAMATTDPQKVLPTILSRVQRLDLRRVGAQDVAAHVKRVVVLEGLSIDDDAVEAVVRAGDGSVRDTLSILEQVLSFGGGHVTGDAVAQVLGHTPAERTFETVSLLAARDIAGLLALTQSLLDEGHDLRRFALDLVQHLRDLLVLQVAPDRPDLVDATAERRTRLAGQAQLLPRETLLRAVDVLAETIAEMRRGPARLPIELALAKLALPEVIGDVAALADRVARLETAAPRPAHGVQASGDGPAPRPAHGAQASGDGPAPRPADGVGAPRDAGVPHPEITAADATEVPAAGPVAHVDGDVFSTVVGRWRQVLDHLKQHSVRLHAIAQAGTPMRLEGDGLVLAFPSSFHADEVGRPDHAEAVRKVIEQVCDVAVQLRTEVASGDGDPPAPDPAPLSQELSQEETEVGEAEHTGHEVDEHTAATHAATLLREELGAQPVEER
ncbi:MAG: DNA polymerase III subunit gamma/tau [Actinobacteria bacterium]|nr:DNA polymerase III subunit gamma/tau [Actinomycetota bacterium]